MCKNNNMIKSGGWKGRDEWEETLKGGRGRRGRKRREGEGKRIKNKINRREDEEARDEDGLRRERNMKGKNKGGKEEKQGDNLITLSLRRLHCCIA